MLLKRDAIILRTGSEIEKLRESNLIVAEVLEAIRGIVKPGEEIEIIGIKETQRLWRHLLKCLIRCLMKAEPVIMLAFCFAGLRKRILKGDKF